MGGIISFLFETQCIDKCQIPRKALNTCTLLEQNKWMFAPKIHINGIGDQGVKDARHSKIIILSADMFTLFQVLSFSLFFLKNKISPSYYSYDFNCHRNRWFADTLSKQWRVILNGSKSTYEIQWKVLISFQGAKWKRRHKN